MNRSLPRCLLFVFFLACGCSGKGTAFDPERALSRKVSGERAFAHVESLVGLGPRPSGSEAIERSRAHIEEVLGEAGWETRRQAFTKKTPDGSIEFVNLRARFGTGRWEKKIRGILCSHYDTKYYEGFEFVGANDAGSSTGLLLELAGVLAENPDVAERIELVFFDGEEARGPNITRNDGLYGSRHYASELLLVKESLRPEWGVLLDMVGDRDLNIRAAVQIPRSSIRELAEASGKGYAVDIEAVEERLQEMSRQLLAAAGDLDVRSQVGVSPDYIIDDHVPLAIVAGIPTIDLIDFDYDYWHTPGDTLDKIGPESLEVTGRVTLHLVEKYLLAR